MAKQATDDLDLASLSANWKPQDGSIDYSENYQYDKALDANGDVSCVSSAFGDKISASRPYKYCGSDLGTALAAIQLGSVQNNWHIDSIAVDTGLQVPVITFSYHKHTANNHADGSEIEYTLPADMVTILDAISGKKGSADFFKNASSTIGLSSSNFTFSCEHEDVVDGDGDQLAGANSTGLIEATETYVNGQPITLGGTANAAWYITSPSTSDGNTQHDGSSITAQRDVVQDA